METKVDFLGQGFGGGVFVKGYGFLQAVDEKEAGVAVLQMMLQVLADLGIQLAVDVFGQLFQDFLAGQPVTFDDGLVFAVFRHDSILR
jgi:hypothetical protein